MAAAGDNNTANLRALWDTDSEDLFNVLFFTTKGGACFVVHRFAGKRLGDGSGHEQRAWAALRKKFDGFSREAMEAKHPIMRSVQMLPVKASTSYL